MISSKLEKKKNFGVRPGARRHRRGWVGGILGDIADSKSVFRGAVVDISEGGFRMSDLPATTSLEKHIYTAIVSKNGKNYKMIVTPCWQEASGSGLTSNVGFKIVDAPWSWVAFTRENISDNDYDLKGEVEN